MGNLTSNHKKIEDWPSYFIYKTMNVRILHPKIRITMQYKSMAKLALKERNER